MLHEAKSTSTQSHHIHLVRVYDYQRCFNTSVACKKVCKKRKRGILQRTVLSCTFNTNLNRKQCTWNFLLFLSQDCPGTSVTSYREEQCVKAGGNRSSPYYLRLGMEHYWFLKLINSQPWRRFGYPVLISIDFNDFTSPFTP